jgi:hypothetical protein
VFLEYRLLFPFEWVGGLVVGGYEVVHVFAQLAGTSETGPAGFLQFPVRNCGRGFIY